MSKYVVDTERMKRGRWHQPWEPPKEEYAALVRFGHSFNAYEHFGGGLDKVQAGLKELRETCPDYENSLVYQKASMFCTMRHLCSGLGSLEMSEKLWEELKARKALIEQLESDLDD